MIVREKFTVNRVEHHEYRTNYQQHKVVLTPQYDPDIPDDQKFAKSTPSGEITMMVDNPLALEEFKPARAFYVEFKAVDEVVSAAK